MAKSKCYSCSTCFYARMGLNKVPGSYDKERKQSLYKNGWQCHISPPGVTNGRAQTEADSICCLWTDVKTHEQPLIRDNPELFIKCHVRGNVAEI